MIWVGLLLLFVLLIKINTDLLIISPNSSLCPTYSDYTEYNVRGICVWVFEPISCYNKNNTAILTCHGRKNNMSHCLKWYSALRSVATVIAFDYRGFGKSDPVKVTLETLEEDAGTVYSWASSRYTIISAGHSLGCLPALSIPASHYILDGGFYRFDTLKKWIQLASKATDLSNYSIGRRLDRIPPSKILVLHGLQDTVVPIEESTKIASHALFSGHEVVLKHLPGNHSIWKSRPQEYAEVVANFIA